jgi:hypothetical protein
VENAKKKKKIRDEKYKEIKNIYFEEYCIPGCDTV